MLRALDDAGAVAARLRQAWVEVNGAAAPAPGRDRPATEARRPVLATS
jgi:hypothetical protein